MEGVAQSGRLDHGLQVFDGARSLVEVRESDTREQMGRTRSGLTGEHLFERGDAGLIVPGEVREDAAVVRLLGGRSQETRLRHHVAGFDDWCEGWRMSGLRATCTSLLNRRSFLNRGPRLVVEAGSR